MLQGKGLGFFLWLLGEKVFGSFLGNVKDSKMDFLGCLPCESSALGMCGGSEPASELVLCCLQKQGLEGIWVGFLPYIWQHGLKINLLKQQIKFGFLKTVILNRSPGGKQPGPCCSSHPCPASLLPYKTTIMCL